MWLFGLMDCISESLNDSVINFFAKLMLFTRGMATPSSSNLC